MKAKHLPLLLLALCLFLFQGVAVGQEPIPDSGSTLVTPLATDVHYFEGTTRLETEANRVIAEAINKNVRRSRLRRGQKARVFRGLRNRNDFEDTKWAILEQAIDQGLSVEDAKDPQKLAAFLESDFDWGKFFEEFLKPLLELIKELFLSDNPAHQMYAVILRDEVREFLDQMVT